MYDVYGYIHVIYLGIRTKYLINKSGYGVATVSTID